MAGLDKYMNWWKRQWGKHNITFWIVIIFLGLITLGIIFTLFEKTHDFGLNFLPEMIGGFITVIIIDTLISKREEKKMLPLRYVIYQEVSLLYNWYVHLFYDLYYQISLEEPPGNFKEFYDNGCLRSALLYTDIHAQALTYPKIPLYAHIAKSGKDIREKAEGILENYVSFMKPEFAQLIYKLFVNNHEVLLIEQLPSSINVRSQMPFPSSLIYYFSEPDPETVNGIQRLEEWLESERQKLSGLQLDLRPLAVPLSSASQPLRTLHYKLDENFLNEQIQRFNEWREQQQNQNLGK